VMCLKRRQDHTPWHYSASMADGSTPATISELPLHWFYGPGVKLDFRGLPDGHVVTAAEVESELVRIQHKIRPGDVVLVNTAAGVQYGRG
jgi:kynurenine formamidase